MSYTKRYEIPAKVEQSVTAASFNKNVFEATQGQTTFALTFVLTSKSLVFVNSGIVSAAEYTGVGTEQLVFNNPLSLYDKIVIIG